MHPTQPPDPPRRTVLAWSSGKDCAFALHHLRITGAADVVALLTTVDMDAEHVPVHDTPLPVLRAQADSIRLPLLEVPIPWPRHPSSTTRPSGAYLYRKHLRVPPI